MAYGNFTWLTQKVRAGGRGILIACALWGCSLDVGGAGNRGKGASTSVNEGHAGGEDSAEDEPFTPGNEDDFAPTDDADLPLTPGDGVDQPVPDGNDGVEEPTPADPDADDPADAGADEEEDEEEDDDENDEDAGADERDNSGKGGGGKD